MLNSTLLSVSTEANHETLKIAFSTFFTFVMLWKCCYLTVFVFDFYDLKMPNLMLMKKNWLEGQKSSKTKYCNLLEKIKLKLSENFQTA